MTLHINNILIMFLNFLKNIIALFIDVTNVVVIIMIVTVVATHVELSFAFENNCISTQIV